MTNDRLHEFGPFLMEEAEGRLFRKGKLVHLMPKESGVLRLLLQKRGSTVRKEEFKEKIWPELHRDLAVDPYLKRAISTLRKKLGDKKTRPKYLFTIPQGGYSFMPSPSRKETIIVLPFQSLGRSKQPDYFVDGVTLTAITQLNQLNPERLGVIAAITAMRYKNSPKTIREIAEEVEAGHVVTGALLWSGSKVRFSVQLVRAGDEIQLWAETYQWKLGDIFVFLGEVCQDIARALEIRPREKERLAELSRVNPEACKSYLEGRYLWSQRTPESLSKASEAFEDAIGRESRFALAHSALADCYAVMASQSWMPPRQACARAQAAATRAIHLDRGLAEPHAARGFILSVFERQWDKAEKEFQEALKLNANCITAHHWYSFYLAAMDRLPEAVRQIGKAQAIDPLARMVNTNVGTMLYWDRQYDAAIEKYDHALALDPDFWYACWMRGMAYEAKKQYREAEASQRRAMRHFPDSPLLAASLARTLALAGDWKGARRHLEKAGRAPHTALPYYHFASAHAALGENNAAFDCLFDSCDAQEMWISFIQVDPKMDSLRPDPKYKELRHRLGL